MAVRDALPLWLADAVGEVDCEGVKDEYPEVVEGLCVGLAVAAPVALLDVVAEWLLEGEAVELSDGVGEEEGVGVCEPESDREGVAVALADDVSEGLPDCETSALDTVELMVCDNVWLAVGHTVQAHKKSAATAASVKAALNTRAFATDPEKR